MNNGDKTGDDLVLITEPVYHEYRGTMVPAGMRNPFSPDISCVSITEVGLNGQSVSKRSRCIPRYTPAEKTSSKHRILLPRAIGNLLIFIMKRPCICSYYKGTLTEKRIIRNPDTSFWRERDGYIVLDSVVSGVETDFG